MSAPFLPNPLIVGLLILSMLSIETEDISLTQAVLLFKTTSSSLVLKVSPL